jgi:hypothetical protein
MSFDIKNSLLKSSIGGNAFSGKNVQTSIDQSMISSTEQKSLKMDLKQETDPGTESVAEKANKKKKRLQKELEAQKNAQLLTTAPEKIIERDPLKLLKLI